jgi:glycosyltransferase involved in cell wall biosynthesis
MSTNPLVSIIINCHNGEKYLRECLNSVISQTYKNWEIVFFDNLSEDRSKSILDEYSGGNINYFKSEKFLRLYEARNLAISKAVGKYICFLDVDDFWIKEKLEYQVKFLEENKNFEMVYSNYYTFDQKKNRYFIKNDFNLPYGIITNKLLKNYTIGFVTTCVRKNIFLKTSFDNRYEIIGDFDFFIKLSKKISIGCIQKPLASYRVHNKNLSKKKISLYVNELKNWIQENESDFSKKGYSFANQKFLLYKLTLKKYLSFLGV